MTLYMTFRQPTIYLCVVHVVLSFIVTFHMTDLGDFPSLTSPDFCIVALKIQVNDIRHLDRVIRSDQDVFTYGSQTPYTVEVFVQLKIYTYR